MPSVYTRSESRYCAYSERSEVRNSARYRRPIPQQAAEQPVSHGNNNNNNKLQSPRGRLMINHLIKKKKKNYVQPVGVARSLALVILLAGLSVHIRVYTQSLRLYIYAICVSLRFKHTRTDARLKSKRIHALGTRRTRSRALHNTRRLSAASARPRVRRERRDV